MGSSSETAEDVSEGTTGWNEEKKVEEEPVFLASADADRDYFAQHFGVGWLVKGPVSLA